MKNPFTTIAESEDRIETLERATMQMVDTLAVHGADMLELLKRIGQLEAQGDVAYVQRTQQEKATQIAQENLRALSESARRLADRVAQLEQQARSQLPLQPFSPVFDPRPGFNPNIQPSIQWPSTLFPNGMPTFTAQQARDDADMTKWRNQFGVSIQDQADITRTAQPTWDGEDEARRHQKIIASIIADSAMVLDSRAIARMSTMPVGKDLRPTDGLNPV